MPTEVEEKVIPRTLAVIGSFLLLIALGSFWQNSGNFIHIGLAFLTLFFSGLFYWLKRPIIGYPHLENRVSKDGSVSEDGSE